MTGFARQEGGDDVMTWVWEVKSVNGRNLDLRLRLPQGFEALEAEVRKLVPEHLARGNVQISLVVDRSRLPLRYRVNRELLQQLLGLTKELGGDLPAAPPRLDGLLTIKGVLEPEEGAEEEAVAEARNAAMLADLTAALGKLVRARGEEGARLEAVITAHLRSFDEVVEAAGKSAELQPAALRARLAAQIAELLEASPGLPEERLAQEAALLATKADIREELDRLRAHLASARDLMKVGGAVGRRFDFLCQELNREANTLCSKSVDMELTRQGLTMKTLVDKLREQVQNIE
ncbi:MAG: YicC/YloC family endoribonuclease [Kiloniellales bacterium]|nr:YicC/YloC family endoribonuclease [Kiloniellales bacterium]